MDVLQLKHQWVDLISALFREGLLNEQFTRLKQLQDAHNPDFVLEVVTLFFENSEKLLSDLCNILNQRVVDFNKVCAHVYKLKGSSLSIGAPRVTNVCFPFSNCCDEGDLEGCFGCLQQLKQEYSHVKSKLDTLLRLEQQIVAAGGSLPMI